MPVASAQGYRGKLVDRLTGTILDQFADEDIKVSTNILDLFDLGEIPGTYTQQITLPGTKINNAFFEQYYDISVWEPDIFNTNQVAEAYLDFDGFYLVNGFIQLNKVNVLANKFVESYEITLFGIISNFSIDTKTSFLTDLSSLSVYNHTSSVMNITASWAGNLFNGDIVYPMIEYGNDATDQPNFYFSQVDFLGIDDNESAIVVSDYKPAIRIKKVWDAIFNEFGYTYTGSFWNEPFLENVYMPLNNNKQVPVYNPAIDTYYQAKLTNVSASSYFLTAYDSSSATNFRMNSRVYDYNNAAALSGSTFTFTSPITSKYDVKLDLAFEVSGTNASFSGMPAWYVDYVSGSTVVNTQVLARLNTYLTTIADSRARTVQEVFNIRDYLFQTPELQPGTYTIRIYQLPINFNVYTVKLNPNVNSQCSIEFWRCRQAADFKILDVPLNMPNGTSGIRVMDFIRSIQKKFNLIIYPSKTNPNQFIVETFNTWYKQGTVKNFNKYINLDNPITFTPANQLGYKQVRFSDAEDTDYVTTLFKRTNNRVYGESNFYDSGSYYSQGKLDVTSDVIGNGPLTLVPGSVYTGSVAVGGSCTSYQLDNDDPFFNNRDATYTPCGTISPVTITLGPSEQVVVCSNTIPFGGDGWIRITEIGDCSPAPATGSIYGVPMWIPYYIADDKYTPARVLPRLYFYNGLVESQKYWIEGYQNSTSSVAVSDFYSYPYFDNYSTGSLNGTASQYPQLDSLSLLYNNEQSVWGTTPSGSLISDYWATYLGLLYNPRTRLVDATAVIPLAQYFDLELNDIAQFRGNYYHVRAINDYNITTGECNIQLLGPIISDTIATLYSGSWANTITSSYNACTMSYVMENEGITGSLWNWDFNWQGGGIAQYQNFGTTYYKMSYRSSYTGSFQQAPSGSPFLLDDPESRIGIPSASYTYLEFAIEALTGSTPIGTSQCVTCGGVAITYLATGSVPAPTPSPTSPPTPSPTGPTPSPTTPAPTTAAPTAPPTTPSPTSAFYYYSIKKYDCDGCSYVSPDLVARSSTSKSTIDGVYYNPSGDGFVYQIQTEITPAPMSFDIDLDGAPSNASCNLACII